MRGKTLRRKKQRLERRLLEKLDCFLFQSRLFLLVTKTPSFKVVCLLVTKTHPNDQHQVLVEATDIRYTCHDCCLRPHEVTHLVMQTYSVEDGEGGLNIILILKVPAS